MDFFFNYHCQNHSVDAKSLWPITTFYLSSYLHNFARIFIIQASYHTVLNLHLLSKYSTSRIYSNFSAKIYLKKFCQNCIFWRKLDFWSSVLVCIILQNLSQLSLTIFQSLTKFFSDDSSHLLLLLRVCKVVPHEWNSQSEKFIKSTSGLIPVNHLIAYISSRVIQKGLN